jgi:tight adherence protein C
MISVSTLVCFCLAGLMLVPWRVRPRSLEPRPTPSRRSTTIGPVVPAGALWGGTVVAAVVVHPFLAIPVLLWPRLRRRRRDRSARIAGDRALVRVLPEVVDLVVLGVGAGLTPRAALAGCESWLPPPFHKVFREARRRADAGESFATALEATADALGDRARPLVSAIVAAEHTPGSVLPTLVRVGDEARRRRRVEAQERARRLPVTMLLPLVLCVLPAFALLAVAPLMISSLRGLGLGL